MAERLPYPYIPGKAGLPLHEIAGINGTHQAASGRLVECTFEPRSVLIVEPGKTVRKERVIEVDPSAYRLRTGADLNTLTLDLMTKRDFLLFQRRHPDMFPRHFIGFALDWFKQQGITIDHFRGKWGGDSVNLDGYKKNRRLGASPAEAARDTWSGRMMAQFGFTEIEERDVSESSGMKLVVAHFHKQ